MVGKKSPPQPPPPPPPPPDRDMGRVFGPCVKCGGTDVHVAFHDGRAEKMYPGTYYPACEYSKPCGPNGKAGAHLAVHCRRCGFDWFEQPSDAVGGQS
jgi:hypothetical protein